MKRFLIFLMTVVALTLMGCASPQDKAYEAQAEVSNERLKLIETYQKCVDEAGGDAVKAETCEQYLKAADALK